MQMLKILTHRGLNPAKPGYYAESSLEAFRDQLGRGCGLEFDVQFGKGAIHITHDGNFNPSVAVQLPDVLRLIFRSQSPDSISALHLKSDWQEPRFVDALLSEIKKSGISPKQFIIFDLKPETAKKIKEQMPELLLAASVSHPYDIARYNAFVGGTLLSTEEILGQRDLFSWAWLDEWDLRDENGGKKKFYTPQIFETLRAAGLGIALVTPELHATSPGLLGGERHEDGADHTRLTARFQEIIALGPDAICTDYPDEVRAIVKAQAASQTA